MSSRSRSTAAGMADSRPPVPTRSFAALFVEHGLQVGTSGARCARNVPVRGRSRRLSPDLQSEPGDGAQQDHCSRRAADAENLFAKLIHGGVLPLLGPVCGGDAALVPIAPEEGCDLYHSLADCARLAD